MQAIVTVVTRSHFATAEALFSCSDSATCGSDRYICIADEVESGDPVAPPVGCRSLDPSGFGIPAYRRFCFQYTPLELVCALKPYMLRQLLGMGYERVIYLDSDIYIVGSLGRVFDALDRSSILLTPHITEPFPSDGKLPDEQYLLRSGIYNAGFVGVTKSPAGASFLNWWCDRTLHDCIDNQYGFVFVDQRWLDFVPGMFDGVVLIRDPGVNVAYWNLHNRAVTRLPDGGWQINGTPLAFFHFSGFDPDQPQRLSKHQDRIDPTAHGDLSRLCAEYAVLVRRYRAPAPVPLYGFGSLDTGEPIRPIWREAVRVDHPLLARVDDPFRVVNNPALRAAFSKIQEDASTDPLLARFRLPGIQQERLESLERSVVFGPLLAVYRRLGFIKW